MHKYYIGKRKHVCSYYYAHLPHILIQKMNKWRLFVEEEQGSRNTATKSQRRSVTIESGKAQIYTGTGRRADAASSRNQGIWRRAI